MALVKGRFVDKTIPIQSDNDPVDLKDLARKGYVDQKAADEAAAAVAALDLSAKADLVDGKVPSSQLPGYVDDVEEYADLAGFPAEGSAGKLYVAQDSNKVYRWSGTVYIEISASPGSTDEVAEGAINLYFTDERAQLALVSALSDKADLVHTHVAADITDFDSAAEAALADELSGKQDSLGTGTTSQFLRGDLSWQEVPTSVGIAQTKVVSKSGDDLTGDGTFTKPFATIAAAMASITDASPTKRYMVKVQAGAYTEGALALKANVFIVGDLKEAVRITASSVAMGADFTGSADNRSGIARVILTGACNFDWSTVTSAAGKLYFTEVSFNSAMTMYGHNNATAQAQFDSCQFFSSLTISGINVGVFTNNYSFGSITLNQHPNGGMPTILATAGGQCSGTVTLNATVSDFNRRCSLFARNFMMGAITVNGASAYADVTDSSLPSAGPTVTNGGNVVKLNPQLSAANLSLSNLSFPTAINQPLMPAANNATNLGDWGKQWMFNFAYVHGSAGTDMYLLSAMENYDPAGDSAGRSIFINPDAYGLQANVSGGNIELETAAVSGTGVKGKVQIKARELDMTSVKITNLADGTDAQDAVSKSQLEAAISAIPAAQMPVGKKERIVLTATDISNGYIDCAFEAMSETLLLMTGGVVHNEGSGDDYVLSVVGGVTRITFEPDLAAILAEGDDIYLQYLRIA